MTTFRKILLGILILAAMNGLYSIIEDTYRFFIADDPGVAFERADTVSIDNPYYERFKDSVNRANIMRQEQLDRWVEGFVKNPDSARRADSIEAAMSSAYTDKLIEDLRRARHK